MLKLSVSHGQSIASADNESQSNTRVQFRRAIRPSHVPPGYLVIAHALSQ